MAKKQVNPFSIAFLDVMACALGAVLLLYVIVPKVSSEEVEAIREHREIIDQIDSILERLEASVERDLYVQILREVEELQQQIEAMAAENRELQESLTEAQETIDQYINELRDSNFVVITMSWSTNEQDVDLWIVDPQGNQFSYQDRNHSGVPGNLAADTRRGPGVEVWEAMRPVPGAYRIYANLYSRGGNAENPTVRTRMFYRHGVRQMRSVVLNDVYATPRGNIDLERMQHVATFHVTHDGSINFE